MAKRAPADDMAYSPLDANLAQSVVQGTGRTLDGGVPSRERDGERSTEPLSVIPPGSLTRMPTRSVVAAVTSATRSLKREKRVLLTPEEERQAERLVDRMGEQLGTSVKLSHMLRACITVLCHAEVELLQRAAEMRPLPRPGNGDAVALAQFEQALARLLSRGLRDAPPVR